jgi:hypothetical protein
MKPIKSIWKGLLWFLFWANFVCWMFVGAETELRWLVEKSVLWGSRHLDLHLPSLPLNCVIYAGAAAFALLMLWAAIRGARKQGRFGFGDRVESNTAVR